MNCFRCLYHESHRCRNEKKCPDGMAYVEYTGSIVRQCLEATTEIYQDGYIHCPILESTGCVECEKRFGDGSKWEYDESQNYERKPRWREVRELAKKAEVEEKHCPKLQSSCGGVNGMYFIECKEVSQAFSCYENFSIAYDICLRHPEDCKIAKERELLSQLIGKEIKTHYNTGGIVTNIIGPHDRYGPGSWTINYTKDGKKSKNPFIINSIKVENGVITCEGKPLEIIDPLDDGPLFDEQKCRVCGCTDSNACLGGCYWVEDDLCSKCAESGPESCANCGADKDSCQAYQACMSEGLEPEECVCENWKREGSENENSAVNRNADNCNSPVFQDSYNNTTSKDERQEQTYLYKGLV